MGRLPSESQIDKLATSAIAVYRSDLDALCRGNVDRATIDKILYRIISTRQLFSIMSMCAVGGSKVGIALQSISSVLCEYRPRLIKKISHLYADSSHSHHNKILLKYFNPRATIASAMKASELAEAEQRFLKNITNEGISPTDLVSEDVKVRATNYKKWINRAIPNKSIFDAILAARHSLAKIQGYTSAFAMLTADQMYGGDAEHLVAEFYEAHLPAAKEAADYLLTKYRAIDPSAVTIPAHSFLWLMEKEQSAVSIDTVRAVEVFLNFYRKFLNVEITSFDSSPFDYAVLITGNDFYGEIYFSLFYNESKFSHYAEIASCGLDGKPFAVVVCSFGKTISIREAGILAHELTHAFHELGKNRTLLLSSGTNMPFDIVEAPAVRMQKVIIESTIRELLPFATEAELKSVKMSSKIESLSFMNRCTMAKFDILIHKNVIPGDKIADLYRNIMAEHSLVEIDPNDNSYLSFGHFASGYAGVYYSYINAELLAANMKLDKVYNILASGGNDLGWALPSVVGGADRIKNLDAYPASQFETYVRGRIERLTGKKFPSVYPDWLVYKGRELELDGYCAELHLAFECQGPQHTNFTSMDKVYSQYIRRLENDRAKVKLCNLHGVGLIHIDFRVPKMLLGSYIRSRIFDVSEAWRAEKNKQASIEALEFLATKAPDYMPAIDYPAVIKE